jgi:hypothetical protein
VACMTVVMMILISYFLLFFVVGFILLYSSVKLHVYGLIIDIRVNFTRFVFQMRKISL